MASIINTVRATVLSIANKNNYGYITPSDFNLYAKQAQLDIFEDYFYQHNNWIVKQNARVSGSGYADIVKGLVEVVDSFSLTSSYTPILNQFDLPNEYYLVNKIYFTTDSTELERVSQSKILSLNASQLTAPSEMFPAYTLEENTVTIYPSSTKTIKIQYIRYPKDPNWTYISLNQGEPVFDQSASDYQDFELPLSDQVNLVNKILQYAGMSIREIPLVQFGQAEESIENTQQG
jgi:hypothetical protein